MVSAVLSLLGVKLSTISKRLGVGCRFAANAVTLLAWLGVCTVEVSPKLHSLLHRDAQSPSHNCLVTQLQKHLVDSGFVPAVTPVPSFEGNSLAIFGEVQVFAFFDYRLSSSRAPPPA